MDEDEREKQTLFIVERGRIADNTDAGAPYPDRALMEPEEALVLRSLHDEVAHGDDASETPYTYWDLLAWTGDKTLPEVLRDNYDAMSNHYYDRESEVDEEDDT